MCNIIVNVGNIAIGRGLPIIIQSMCNCPTDDIPSAVAQCISLHKAGSQMIRLTTQGIKEVESLREIKSVLRAEGISTPLIADVHFSSDVAIAAASVADKVRINPGNFDKNHDRACAQFRRLIEVCKEHGTAIRIGVNHGSLGDRITEIYGNTPEGMVEAIKEWVKMCIDLDFYSVVLSLKASNVPVMTSAYRLLNGWMNEIGIIFPLHLGVTEAGNGDMGRIKSATGLSVLLSEGIGETVRVSLTEPPEHEIPVAAEVVSYFSKPYDTSVKNNFSLECKDYDEFLVDASCRIGPLLLNHQIDDFSISCKCAGKELQSSVLEQFKSNIFQATKRRVTQCEYIACPSCGRTLYDIEKTFNEVKRRTSHLHGLTIAVMGCIVNGPGEMADADYGYVGEGRGMVTIYKGKEPIRRMVHQEEAIDVLLDVIEHFSTFATQNNQ